MGWTIWAGNSGALSPCFAGEGGEDPQGSERVRGLFAFRAVGSYASTGASLRSAPPSPSQPRVFPGLAIHDWSKSETSGLDGERESERAARSLHDHLPMAFLINTEADLTTATHALLALEPR